jgi:hypothetical protein
VFWGPRRWSSLGSLARLSLWTFEFFFARFAGEGALPLESRNNWQSAI